MDPFLTPSVAMGAGSTPGAVFARSNGTDDGVQFGAESEGRSKQLFALSKSKTDGWKVGEGWVYCGLVKVDAEAVTLGAISGSATVYVHVKTDGKGGFTAEVSKDADNSAVASIVLYEFENGKLKLDGRLAPTIPLYN